MKTISARIICCGIVLIVSVAAVVQVCADSIWARREQQSAHLFVDNRARRIGDILTVKIREITGIDNAEGRELGKDTNGKHTFDFKGSIASNGETRDVTENHEIEGTSKREFQTNARFASDQVFTDEISVVVVDVLPNGNLLVEGMRDRSVAGETRILRVSGIVRPNDIDSQEEGNFVDSRLVANFRISYEGAGVETKFTRQGWLGRIMNHLWPF